MLMSTVNLDSGMGIFFIHILKLPYKTFFLMHVLGIVFCRAVLWKIWDGFLQRQTCVPLSASSYAK